MHLLEGKPDFKDVFATLWSVQKDRRKNEVILFDNPNIIFGHADFDKDVIIDEDKLIFDQWAKELNLDYLGTTYTEIYAAISKIKKNPYKKLKSNELKYFNRLSWRSLYRKGVLLLDSFYEQFYPKIEKVLATQKFCLIKDENTGDIIQGVVDAILKITGYDDPIVFDLKTASQPYKQDQIDRSDQLTLYLAMEGWKYKTNLVGYIVLSKNINKEKESFCKVCNHKKNGSHRTCNNMVNAIEPNQKPVRCNGEWLETTVIKPIVQVMVARKSQEQMDSVLDDQSNMIVGMKNGIVFKNTSKCENWYGNRCPYFKLCHSGDMTGLTKKD